MRSKAERVHHAKRVKQKVRHYLAAGDKSPRAIGMVARARAMCSCLMCGNPRKVDGDKVKYKALSQRLLAEGWDG